MFDRILNIFLLELHKEAYLEPSQTSKLELFVKIVNAFYKKGSSKVFDWALIGILAYFTQC